MSYYNPYHQQNFSEQVKSFFRSGSSLSILLFVNIGIWLCICIAFLVAWLYKMPIENVKIFIANYLAVPAYLPTLLHRFWTPFTYMFLHFDFWHILFNMLWLYWFGRIFLEFLNSKKLSTVYVLGGLSGALLYVLAYNIFPVFDEGLPYSYALGASASVMAIVVAISCYVPHYSLNLFLIGRIKLIWFALIYIMIDLLSIRHGNAGGHIAHLGGAFFGFLYAFNLQKGFIKANPFRHFRSFSKKKTNDSKIRKNYTADNLYNIQKRKEQEEIDRILDKISKHGYDALSKKEKEVLFKKSKE